MDSYSLQRHIIPRDCLSPTEQHIALLLALFYDRKRGYTQISQRKLAELSGYSERTVKRVFASLKGYGLVSIQQTRRVAKITFLLEKECGNMEVPWVSPLEVPSVSRCNAKCAYKLDTELSTKAEERCKKVGA